MILKNQKNIKENIKKLWDWTGYYWYPLDSCNRTDILAFDESKLEDVIPEVLFDKFLRNFYKGQVYFFPELDSATEESVNDLDLGYGYSETFVVSKNLKNIVYWSHESTITLGGIDLINKFKIEFTKWDQLLYN